MEFSRKRLRKIGNWCTVASLFVPWTVYTYKGGYTFFFSLGYTDSFSRFIDIWNYTFVYTDGTFTADFWFWHIALVFVSASIPLVFLGYGLLGASFQFFGGISVIRLTLALVENGAIPFYFPLGALWMIGTSVLIYFTREKRDNILSVDF